MEAYAVFDQKGQIRLDSIGRNEAFVWMKWTSDNLGSSDYWKVQGFTCHQVEITKKPVGE